ncbi:chromosomal replication initiator protein DnaA [Candidatus Berkelbacteria bacterium]|nr:chromosomal replication initiator protein DnaA [Candidatus Berkelbacteria bacterium]
MKTVENPAKVWQIVLGELEIVLSKANYKTWFKNSRIVDVTDEEVVIGVWNTFARSWLRDKYHSEILETLKRFYPGLRRVEYQVSSAQSPNRAPKKESNSDIRTTEQLATLETIAQTQTQASADVITGLNANHTFETFIVGNSNRLAHAAATAIAQKPGLVKYNPLYFYGGVGLGKTHLLQAIGNEIKKHFPKKTVLYASCEKFTSEFIEALQAKKLDAFKKRYRNADLLLIDDIQFLSGKEGTQEEFFHTFNTLHQTNRQIVMTSDMRPQSIPSLEPRLSSRFGWGMVADIQSPDFETRQAILKHKCLERSFTLPTEIIEYIAQHVQSNIRNLEGALNSVIVHCELYNVAPSTSLVERILSQTGANLRSKQISIDQVFQTTAEFFSLEMEELLGKRRLKEFVYPRQIAMYILRYELGYSYPQIGKMLGGKDHTTIMHGVHKIEHQLATRNDTLQREINSIKEQLYAN